MSTIRILHAADLHLDSPFEGLPAGKAAARRKEQRALLTALAELAGAEQVDLVLLSGDLLDSANTYFETGDELVRALQSIAAPVFIAPGNHDYYTAKSPYARLKLPDNVHIFRENRIHYVSLPGLGVRVYGAAFTEDRSGPLLHGFRAERREGVLNVLCMHGEVGVRGSAYNPISEEDLAQSGMDYVALGHIHKASGLQKAGGVWYSWPGCPEGRGFDETGEKTVSIVELSEVDCTLRTAVISTHRYEVMKVDVTGTDPLLAIHTRLPDDTVRDVYRIILTGETENTPDLRRLYANLSEMFFELQLRDETRLRHSVWEGAGTDTLRGLFLARLKARYDAAGDEGDRIRIEQAARWGLAAMDNAEEVVQHEDP
ncbi:MAG: DNA repair exonuclease [Oscillospiraceae bacterium]|nr:DNA repair exonuclease [Oscillospiraceae bacterium]